MREVIASIAGMSFAGGVAILFVLLIRQLFRPSRRVCCVMWLLAGLRLLLPFSFADALDLHLPDIASPPAGAVYELIPPDDDTAPASADTAGDHLPYASQPVPLTDEAAASFSVETARCTLTALWLAGAVAVTIGVAAGYIRLRLRLRTAVRVEAGVYQSEHIPAPFVFGLVRPRIYIPYSVADGDIPFVLEHERNHIKRNDHITKAIALAVLALHWFNPLVWAAYLLFCRDVETACDEKVIADMDLSDRRRYSAALLACSTGHRIALCPVGFGEVGVKERIKHIMKYTKPAFARNLLSSVLCIALVLCAFALPVGCAEKNAGHSFEPVDLSDPSYEGTDRVANEDGSVTMIFIPQSNFSLDTVQYFCYSGECASLHVSTSSGFVTTPTENGSTVYITPEDEFDGEMPSAYYSVVDNEGYLAIETQGDTLSVSTGEPVVWIPKELNFGDADSKVNAVITFVATEEDGTKDIATVTVATDENAVTPEGMQALTISVDSQHNLQVSGDDFDRTIIIEKAK